SVIGLLVVNRDSWPKGGVRVRRGAPLTIMLLLVLGAVAAGCAKRPATTSVAAPPPSAPAPAAPPATPAPAPSTPAAAAPVPSTPSTPAPAPAATTARPAPAEFASIPELNDIHFDFDKYDIRPDAARTLDANAAWLKS